MSKLLTKTTFCRICAGKCGLVVDLDERNQSVEQIRGDHKHPMSQGYACIKGLQAGELHHSKHRLLKPLERQPDGSFVEIDSKTALDKIAKRLQNIIRTNGANALATFRGTAHYANSTAFAMLSSFIKAIGTESRYSTMTIDQSAKWVTDHRLGIWAAGRQRFQDADVWLFTGYNPLVSVQGINGFPALNPTKRLKAAKDRGMKTIVIDPRKTETAHFADLHLQCLPGEDPTIMAGIIKIILDNNWHDEEFCHNHVKGLAALKQAVAFFTEDYVCNRAGIEEGQLTEAARLFAEPSNQPKRGIATSGTGPDMAPHSNLAEHLIETLNVICGRFLRAGETVSNVAPMSKKRSVRAEVIAPNRHWEKQAGPDQVMINGEKMSGQLAEHILNKGNGQIKALIIDGGNPVNALPNRKQAITAFKSLDLLVCIDPYLSETAQLADYVLPPLMMLERPDLPLLFEKTSFPEPFAQYTDAIIQPPENSDLIDDWQVFWELGKRLGLPMRFAGVDLDMATPPTAEQLLEYLMRDAQVSLSKIKAFPHGKTFELEQQFVEPSRAERKDNKFEVAPDDIFQQLTGIYKQTQQTPEFPFRLAVRRMRQVMNTSYRQMDFVKKNTPHNPLWVNSQDLSELGIASDTQVSLQSAYGKISATVKADDSMRKGVVAISHGWGGNGGDRNKNAVLGQSINELMPSQERRETINFMPWYSALPVKISTVLPNNNETTHRVTL